MSCSGDVQGADGDRGLDTDVRGQHSEGGAERARTLGQLRLPDPRPPLGPALQAGSHGQLPVFRAQRRSGQ